MKKSRDAFRTISEVSDWLDTPAHVLRFWETKFSQIKPVKRAGGRRYYRPQDMELLGGIKQLLHSDGMSIKAVQSLIKEKGAKHVASFGPSITAPAPEPVEKLPVKNDDTVIETVMKRPAANAPVSDEPAAMGDLFGFEPETNVVQLPTAKTATPVVRPMVLETLAAVSVEKLAARAAKIAPLAAKLAELHGRMVRD